jgi:UDP-N-acetylmuramoyl-L-alanyl-D-glutamate--2,6-diaminopimelate ligase
MLLSSVVNELEFDIIQGSLNIEVSSIAFDSRAIVKDSLFVARLGFTIDGHQFIDKAIELGASTIIVEKEVIVPAHVTVLKVADSRIALARVSANFYNNPTEQLNLIGITGTNGKTSTTYFIQSIFEQAHKSIGIIGTIGTVMNQQVIKNKNTTPESLHLQETFVKMLEANIDHCIMEVSSHALNLHRVAYCSFDTSIFTNLTPDHLELHRNMEEYYQAKAHLFNLTTGYSIVNIDDEYGRRLAESLNNRGSQLLSYGLDELAHIYASNIEYSADSTTFTVHTPSGHTQITVNIPGLIYVYNCLAAIACAYCYGISLADIQLGIRQVQGIKGRSEVVYQDEDYKFVVDFAHTEDGLAQTISTLRPFVRGRLIVVFGVYASDGQEGRDKRRAMGKVAAQQADVAIVTSDNPKDQDPDMIISEIVEAIEEEAGTYVAIVDRKEAIQYAVRISQKGDTILVAGKGHETSQIIGKTEIPFNEAEIILDSLRIEKQLVIK